MNEAKLLENFERIKRGETVNVLSVYAAELLAYVNRNESSMQLKIDYNFLSGQTKFKKW